MSRHVWLFSMDTEQFSAPPMTTGALKANFIARGRTAGDTQVELVHFLSRAELEQWLDGAWPAVRTRANAAAGEGATPVFGFSCYTWNVAEFLDLARLVRHAVPGAVVLAGGPHVQRAEDFLADEAIDVVALGEGEVTFAEFLDCASRAEWPSVAGIAFLDGDGRVHRTSSRSRAVALDDFPSALDVIDLRDPDGRPRYEQVAYETSRGCPYRCAFCEWGTGAIGTKMYQFSLDRIASDLERLSAGGVEDFWLCDSNFGALREDLAKAEKIVELHRRTGRPRGFATSWSKNHNRRVHEIVRLLHREGLLSHYHLALQTLSPGALELSRRTNMRANDYEPVVRALAAEGIPVAAELIWPLPGDTLAEFERSLDHLHTVFPNINIFGYTLLPGTEFFDRREEYRLETVPVAGYGKAKGEYVVGCHTLPRDEAEEGYLSIAAQILLARGHIIPLTVRHLAIDGRASVSALLRDVVRALVAEFAGELGTLDPRDRLAIYENRGELFRLILANRSRAFPVMANALRTGVFALGLEALARETALVLELDAALCPRPGPARTIVERFAFPADVALEALEAMRAPRAAVWAEEAPTELVIDHRGGGGDVILEPDGGAWIKGRVVAARALQAALAAAEA